MLVGEDHGLMLEAIVGRLAADPDMQVVGTAVDGQDLVDTYRALHSDGRRPDVVLCDYSMPRLNGIEAMRLIHDTDASAKVLLLSAFDDRSLVVSAMNAGAVGYLLKSVQPAELRGRVRTAARGEPVLDAVTASHMIGAVRARERRPGGSSLEGAPLSEREVDVLRLVADGMSNSEVATKLYISSQTVKTHMERICSKLGVSGRVAAVKRGLEIGALARS
ncbi:MAG TPA: response regulator transcription factor [Acidimicrobiia bacterium]|nr:response regulator transcription factor [Acidimicrobiia bacterium]